MLHDHCSVTVSQSDYYLLPAVLSRAYNAEAVNVCCGATGVEVLTFG